MGEPCSVLFLFLLLSPCSMGSNPASMPLDGFLADVCAFLELDEEARAAFTSHVKAFLRDNVILNMKMLLTSATEAFLREGKVLPLWPHVRSLQAATGLAHLGDAALAARDPVAPNSERVSALEDEWESLGNTKGSVTIAPDGRSFFCQLCRADVLLSRPDSMSRHSHGPRHRGKMDQKKDIKAGKRSSEEEDDEGEGEEEEENVSQKGKTKKKKEKKKKMAGTRSRKKSKKTEDDDNGGEEGEDGPHEVVKTEKKREKSSKKVEPRSRKKGKKREEDEEEDAGALEQLPLPDTLPSSFHGREVQPDGSLSYWCKWTGLADKRKIPIVALAARYGKAIVAPIMKYDSACHVEFDIEKLLDKKKGGQYLVRWQGYPDVFDSWEGKAALGGNADELIAGLK